jgi:CSLREA domain-containing protein
MGRRLVLVIVGIAVGFAAALLLAACNPPSPSLHLTVTTTADGPDAEPGDGVCEVTPGAGDCSLRAAVDEANASPLEVTISVPSGDYALTRPGTDDTNAGGDLDIASPGGKVSIVGAAPGASVTAPGADGVVDVHGGTAMLSGVSLSGAAGFGVDVRAGATGVLLGSTVHGNGAGLIVSAGAQATVVNTTVAGNTGPGIANAGIVDATFATVTANGGGMVGAGVTHDVGSVIGSQTSGADCATYASSSTFTADSDGSCGLNGTGDQSAVSVHLGALGASGSQLPIALPDAGSPLVDAIPVGTAPCTPPLSDELDHVRPSGAGCDIGAAEVDQGVHLTVDNPADVHDAVPGDGRCDIGNGTCTLRAAVDEANQHAVPGHPNAIDLIVDSRLTIAGAGDDANVSGDLDLTSPTTVAGGGHRVDGGGLDRVFDVRSDGVSLDGVVILGGHLPSPASSDLTTGGAGIRQTTGQLTISHSVVEDNVVDPGPSGTSPSVGGGIESRGSHLEVDASTIAHNTADVGGAIFHTVGTATIAESTLSDNTGGAFYTPNNFIDAAGVGATLSHVTVGGNVARSADDLQGAAVVSDSVTLCGFFDCTTFPAEPVTVAGSIADNPLIGNCSQTTSAGFNVGCGSGPTDLAGPATLAPLGAYGGPTPTQPSFVGGPGVDLIPPGTAGLCDATTATDQRGLPRPVGPGCDSGSVEGDNGRVLTPRSMTVDSAADAPDADVTDGVCAVAGGGCTLRAAIDQANAWPTADTITIAAGVNPIISRAGAGDDQNLSGDFDSTGTLTIIGNGATVDGGSLDRVFDGVNPNASLTLQSLTVTHGKADGDGGAVRSSGALSVSSSTFSGNVSAGNGGAISGGTVQLSSTTLDHNHATGAGGAARASTTLGVSGGSVHDNVAGGNGGGLSAPQINASNATLATNLSISGGAVSIDGAGGGASSITGSAIHDNRAAFGGGGITSAGTLTVDHTTIAHNQAASTTLGTGGGIQNTGKLAVLQSTVSDNTAAVRAGGIANQGGMIVDRSTIHANTGGTQGGAITADGGGGTIIRLSTITDNRLTGSGFGAGIDGSLGSDPVVNVSGSILTNLGEDCWAVRPISGGYNITGNCNLTQATDHRATVGGVDRLADNGGPTQTQLPFQAATAVDAIPVGTLSLCDAGTATDQRDDPRPVGPACDIGAVEGDNGVVATPRTFTVNDATDRPDADPNDGTCATAVGTCSLRAAVSEANTWPASDTIVIAPGVNPTLTIDGAGEPSNTAGDLDLYGPLTIDGNGATIHGDSTDRLFLASPDAPLSLVDVTLSGGQVPNFTVYPGAAISTRAPLLLVRSTITGIGGPSPAIGSSSDADIALVESTIRDNPTSAIGGPIGTATLIRSTLSGNQGGAVVANGVSVTASTISDNQGGITATVGTVTASTVASNGVGFPGSGALTVAGSIVDNQVNCPQPSLVSGGWNLVSSSACGLNATTDVTASSLLAPLGDNGGPTETRLPFANSPAVNSIPIGTVGLCTGSLTDQRGVARPVGPACDRGSVEGDTGTTVGPLSLTVNSAADAPDANPGDGICASTAGGCTLRAAIDETNASPSANTITIAPGINPALSITGADEDANATGDLDITGSVVINGNDQTVDGAGLGLDRVFDVRGGAVAIRHLTVRHGGARDAATIRSVSTLDLDHVTISDSLNFDDGPVFIAGGSATIEDSLITRNQSVGGGGGEAGGVSIFGSSVVRIERTTISANDSSGDSAGIRIAGSPTVAIVDSTIVGNVGRTDGAAINATRLAGGSVTITASTISQNSGPSSLAGPMTVAASVVAPTTGRACAAAVTSGGFNVATDATCGLGATGDRQTTDPRLGGLTANGGPTPTSLPYGNSPLVDAIPVGTAGLCDGTIATDQRGVARPAGSACDVGAVEGHTSTTSATLNLTVNTSADGRDANIGDGVCATAGGQCSLRAAIDEADARVGVDHITIAPGVNPTLSIAGADEDANASGDLDITDSVSIVSANGATISAAQLDRVLDVRSSLLTLDDVTIRDGRITAVGAFGVGGVGGGVRMSGGTADLFDTTVRNNTTIGSSGAGGGLSAFATAFTVRSSTLTANQVGTFSGTGGALEITSGGVATVTESTLTGNNAFGGAAADIDVLSSLSLQHATVSANAGLTQLGASSGITARASIFVANGTSKICSSIGVGSSDWNIASDTSCSLSAPHDQQGVDPRLGALASNGGPTLTQLPGAGSPAIDLIPPGTAGACDASTPTDQRGISRPQGAGCDAGSVEQ